mgnify:CR=1 FL=1
MNNKHNKDVGRIGEDVACKFLMKQGYQILTRNYLKKWGELDIIATKSKKTYFVEVKTVSKDLTKVNSFKNIDKKDEKRNETVSCETNNNVIHETNDEYRPEDNIHPWKLKRLSRVIQTYLSEKNFTEEDHWQFDAITVFLDLKNKSAKVDHLKDIIL